MLSLVSGAPVLDVSVAEVAAEGSCSDVPISLSGDFFKKKRKKLKKRRLQASAWVAEESYIHAEKAGRSSDPLDELEELPRGCSSAPPSPPSGDLLPSPLSASPLGCPWSEVLVEPPKFIAKQIFPKNLSNDCFMVKYFSLVVDPPKMLVDSAGAECAEDSRVDAAAKSSDKNVQDWWDSLVPDYGNVGDSDQSASSDLDSGAGICRATLCYLFLRHVYESAAPQEQNKLFQETSHEVYKHLMAI